MAYCVKLSIKANYTSGMSLLEKDLVITPRKLFIEMSSTKANIPYNILNKWSFHLLGVREKCLCLCWVIVSHSVAAHQVAAVSTSSVWESRAGWHYYSFRFDCLPDGPHQFDCHSAHRESSSWSNQTTGSSTPILYSPLWRRKGIHQKLLNGKQFLLYVCLCRCCLDHKEQC